MIRNLFLATLAAFMLSNILGVKANSRLTRVLKTEFFVTTTGSDTSGDGSRAKPWRSVAHAASQASSPSTIHVGTGHFVEVKPVQLPLEVNLSGAGMVKTTLSASFVAPYLIGLTAKENKTGNQTISGFTVDGNNKTLQGGILVENVNRVTLRDVAFLRCKLYGSMFTDSVTRPWEQAPKAYVTGAKIHDCKYVNSASIQFKNPDGTPAGMSGNLSLGGLDGAQVFAIDIKDVATPGTEDGYGIKFCSGGYFKNLKIHNCRIEVNVVAKAWVSNFCIELWNVGEGCEIFNVQSNTVFSLVNQSYFDPKVAQTKNLKLHHCRIINPKKGGSNNEAIEAYMSGLELHDNYIENASLGMAMWGRGKHISVHNNIFCNLAPLEKVWGRIPPTGIWFSEDGVYQDVKVSNNVFDGTEVGVGVDSGHGGASGSLNSLDIANNVFLHNKGAALVIKSPNDKKHLANVRFRHNLVFDCLPQISGGNQVVSTANLSANPDFRLTGNRWDRYYQPARESSICIGRGINVGLPFQGPAPTIGAHEFRRNRP